MKIKHRVTGRIKDVSFNTWMASYKASRDWDIISEVNNLVWLNWKHPTKGFQNRGVYELSEAKIVAFGKENSYRFDPVSEEEKRDLMNLPPITNNSASVNPIINPSKAKKRHVLSWFWGLSLEHRMLVLSLIGAFLYGLIDILLE